MLNNRFVISISRKMRSSNSSLLKKIGLSLDRDKELPISLLLRKSVVFIKSLFTAPFYLRKCNKVGNRPRTRQKPYIENAGKIMIGNDVNINSKNVQTDLVTGPNGLIEIGNEVSINFGVSIVAEKKVKLGNRIRVGPYTMIFDTDRHVVGDRFKWAGGEPVVIEDDVWLATRVLVLKGSLIGKGAVISGGSVVSGVIPPYVVAGGVPAKVVKFLQPPENETEFSWNREENTGKNYSQETLHRTEQVFKKIFPDLDTFNTSLSSHLVEGWNSYTHVKLVSELEQEFGLKFTRNDWVRLSSPGKMCRIIETYLNQDKNQETLLKRVK